MRNATSRQRHAQGVLILAQRLESAGYTRTEDRNVPADRLAEGQFSLTDAEKFDPITGNIPHDMRIRLKGLQGRVCLLKVHAVDSEKVHTSAWRCVPMAVEAAGLGVGLVFIQVFTATQREMDITHKFPTNERILSQLSADGEGHSFICSAEDLLTGHLLEMIQKGRHIF
jgi:hypothetical protein